jgi:hypothetical protein
MYQDTPYHASADSGAYEVYLTTAGESDTVESYFRYFNWRSITTHSS